MPENRYPDVVKPDKVPFQGSFEEIAVITVNNDIGKIEDNGNGLYLISKSMTDIHARMLAKPAFVVTPIKKNGISCQ